MDRTTGHPPSDGARPSSALIASDRVEGTPVRRSDGTKLGAIERLVIEKASGKVAYAVMSFGGFLGLGDAGRRLPWGALCYNTDLDAYELDLSDDELRGAPAGEPADGDPSAAREWEEHVHRYYRATPYWGV